LTVVTRLSALVVTAAVILCAGFVLVGADSYWAVALGDFIVRAGTVPDGIPFAAASTSGWPNVPVLAQLLFAGFAAAGPVGLAMAQLVADLAALALLGADAQRKGAGDGSTAVALALFVIGSLPALVAVKLQLFSVLLFPLLLLIVRSDHRAPSRRIWWVAGLVALWGNLHGGALIGVLVTGSYLLCSRLRQRPLETMGVGVAVLLALLANPALARTPAYYLGVLSNEAARRGTEMWARPNPANLFDVLLIATGLVLVALALTARPPVWEIVAILGLFLATIMSARNGVWLLMLCVAPAARRLTQGPSTRYGTAWAPVLASLIGVIGCGTLIAARIDALNPSGNPALMSTVKEIAGNRPVLADEPVAESLAAAGVRIWMSNPLDAFSRSDQAAYLDFVSGESGPAMDAAEVIVVRNGGPADTTVASDSRFHSEQSVGGWSIYSRNGAPSAG
jgi:hypothetical protein